MITRKVCKCWHAPVSHMGGDGFCMRCWHRRETGQSFHWCEFYRPREPRRKP